MDSREGSFGFLGSHKLGFLGAYINICKINGVKRQEKAQERGRKEKEKGQRAKYQSSTARLPLEFESWPQPS